MNKKQIEYLLAIESFSSISKAADHLGVSQPTLSKFLLNTEKTLNTKLFSRYSKKVKVTREGTIYLHSFKKILGELATAHQQVQRLKNDYVSNYSIGVHHILARQAIPEIEARLKPYNGMNLNYSLLSSREITEKVAAGELDFGIAADPQKYPDIVIRKIRTEFTGLYSANGKEMDTLFYNSNMIFANRFVKEIDAELTKSIEDYETIAAVVRAKLGMGLLPSLVPNLSHNLKLIQKIGPEIDVCLIYHSNKTKNKALTKIRSILREALSKVS
jgi:DNA-binding transcriptional LysR family regulator